MPRREVGWESRGSAGEQAASQDRSAPMGRQEEPSPHSFSRSYKIASSWNLFSFGAELRWVSPKGDITLSTSLLTPFKINSVILNVQLNFVAFSLCSHITLQHFHSLAPKASSKHHPGVLLLKHPPHTSWGFHQQTKAMVSRWPLSPLWAKDQDKVYWLKSHQRLSPSQEKGKSHLESPQHRYDSYKLPIINGSQFSSQAETRTRFVREMPETSNLA